MEGGSWQDLISFGIGLFAIMVPFACIPIVVNLKDEFTPGQIRQAVMIAVVAAFCILVCAVIGGEAMVLAMGTSLPSFQIAGGVIIAITGLAMMADTQKKPESGQERAKPRTPAQVGIVPLAMPMLSGPGTLTKVMLETHDTVGIKDDLYVVLMIALVLAVAAVILLSSNIIARALGDLGLQIMSKLAGLIVVAIGVEVLVSGIYGHLKVFGVFGA
jgi:multiple antibiotic resistance protein